MNQYHAGKLSRTTCTHHITSRSVCVNNHWNRRRDVLLTSEFGGPIRWKFLWGFDVTRTAPNDVLITQSRVLFTHFTFFSHEAFKWEDTRTFGKLVGSSLDEELLPLILSPIFHLPKLTGIPNIPVGDCWSDSSSLLVFSLSMSTMDQVYPRYRIDFSDGSQIEFKCEEKGNIFDVQYAWDEIDRLMDDHVLPVGMKMFIERFRDRIIPPVGRNNQPDSDDDDGADDFPGAASGTVYENTASTQAKSVSFKLLRPACRRRVTDSGRSTDTDCFSPVDFTGLEERNSPPVINQAVVSSSASLMRVSNGVSSPDISNIRVSTGKEVKSIRKSTRKRRRTSSSKNSSRFESSSNSDDN